MADWGAFLQNLGETGNRSYSGAQDYRFKVAQVAYENALRQREMELREQESALAQEAQRRENEKAAEDLRRATDLEATANELVNALGQAQGPDITRQTKAGVKSEGGFSSAVNRATKIKRAALKMQSRLAPGSLIQGLLPPTPQEQLNQRAIEAGIEKDRAAAYASIVGANKKGTSESTGTEWERSLDELWQIENIPETQRTPEQQFRYRYLKDRVSTDAQKEDSLIVQGRVIRNLADLYGELKWNQMRIDDPETIIKIVNSEGQRMVGEGWMPIRSIQEITDALMKSNLPRTKEEARIRYEIPPTQ